MRTRPYTARGIKRIPCFRCGKPGHSQWQICADQRQYRVVCKSCDVALNALVLRWMGFRHPRAMLKRYRARQGMAA